MKYQISFLVFTVFLMACGDNTTNTMALTGEIKGLKKGSVYLQKLDDTLFTTIDSVVVDGDANFTFTSVIESPEVYYLTLTFQDSSNIVKRLPFFAENGGIHVSTSLKKFPQDATITGSVNQEKWDTYSNLVRRYNDKKLDLIEESLNALKDGNDSLVLALRAKQDKLLIGRYLATVNYALNNKEHEIAPYLMVAEISDANTKYMDTIYSALTPKIKDSKYGKALESLIRERNK